MTANSSFANQNAGSKSNTNQDPLHVAQFELKQRLNHLRQLESNDENSILTPDGRESI